MKYCVKETSELLPFLLANIELSHKKIKMLLKYQNILVNQKVITQYNFLLRKGDIVEIKEYRTKKHDKQLDIVFEDKNIIVLNKPAGLLTISSPKEKEKTLYHMVLEYVKQGNKTNKIFVIHRLDRDTSGIVMFAKNEKVKTSYQTNWNEIVKTRKYAAIVEGILEKKEATLKSYLEENEEGYVYPSKNGKLSITHYQVKKEKKNYSLLDIDIKTGRKNQIRVQLKEIGHPIVGDKKYGKKADRMYLAAYELSLINPVTHKLDMYKVNIPRKFDKFLSQ